MKNSYSIDIEAPPERVFRLIGSSSRAMEWMPTLVEAEDFEVTAGKVGSKFRHVYLENGRRMEMHGTVTAYEHPRHLASELRGDAFDLFVDYRLEDLGGRTRLTQEFEVLMKSTVMKIIGALMRPIMRKASRKQLETSFSRLKALAESPSEPLS